MQGDFPPLTRDEIKEAFVAHLDGEPVFLSPLMIPYIVHATNKYAIAEWLEEEDEGDSDLASAAPPE